MSRKNKKTAGSQPDDSQRRTLLGAAGIGILAATLGRKARAKPTGNLRWGIVGTGGIAKSMAPRIKQADRAELVAVSSRKLETAKAFANKFSIDNAFDSWETMLTRDDVDAIYVATPTSVREEICVAAANAGKHVLGEKPFANLPSLQRITSACRNMGVGFMDGTHFVHHPRMKHIKDNMAKDIGWPWSVASAFQFGMSDTGNIRLNPAFEPYGAIGDAGWYNMRAAVEYTAADIEVTSVDAYLNRHPETNAVVSGSGIIAFNDGSTTTWNCGFESGAIIMDLRISGAVGVIKLNDFLSQNPKDNAGEFDYLQGHRSSKRISIPSAKPGSALMFEDFAAMVGNQERMEASIRASERTQEWLDAVWNSALANEQA